MQCPLTRPRSARSTSPRKRGEVLQNSCCSATKRPRTRSPQANLAFSPTRHPAVFRNRCSMAKAKAAVVTGSTSGIGLAIAQALARGGANVLINGFGDAREIETTRAEIEKQCGVRALYSPADMTKPPEIAKMIQTAEQAFGGVDILVNNAGIQHVAPIEEFPIEKWDQIVAINLSSAFHTIR